MTRSAKQYSAGALHSSVTVESLTTKKFGLTERLYSKRLVAYLGPDEQPHFIINCNPMSFSFTGQDTPEPPTGTMGGTAKAMFTDERLVVVVGNKSGDQTLSIPLEDISGMTYDTSFWSTDLWLTTERGTLEMECYSQFEESDFVALEAYLSERTLERNGAPSVGNGSVEALVAQANHETVTEERLTNVKSGLVSRWLYTKPLLAYLDAGERPAFILDPGERLLTFEGPDAPTAPAPDRLATGLHCLTDRRWLTVTPDRDGDVDTSVALEEITAVTIDPDGTETTVAVSTDEYAVQFHLDESHAGADLESIEQFLRENTSIGETAFHLDAQPQGDWVTKERIAAVSDVLDPKEPVHYLCRGSSMHVELAGTADRSWQSEVVIAITDTRIVATVDGGNGSHLREIPFASVRSCALDTSSEPIGLVCETVSGTYRWQRLEPDESEIETALEFVRSTVQTDRDQSGPVARQNSSGFPATGTDPTEQLKNLSELYEAGILTEDEFESKKQELLGKI